MKTEPQALFTRISIDGEWFQMRIPNTDQYERFLQFLKEHNRLPIYLEFAHPVIVHGDTLNFTRMLLSASPSGNTTMGMVTKKNNNYVFQDDMTDDCMVFFHPCLMPIGNNGKLQPIPEDNVPTGTIVSGGTVYLEDKPATLPVMAMDGQGAKIIVTDGDPQDKRLDYIAFEGMLWSIKPILFSNVNALYKSFTWVYLDYSPSTPTNTNMDIGAEPDDDEDFPF